MPIFYDPAYRLPLPSASLPSGLELRRADYVAWYLLEVLRVSPENLHRPSEISFRDLRLVHSRRLLETLLDAKTLAGVFAVDSSEVSVDDVLHTIRLACGATLGATKLALEERRPVLNMLGGFHHAGPDRAGPLCPVNDIAIALRSVQRAGFDGRASVLDLDAHPPDGTADCLASDPSVWIGSISGSDWGPLPDGVDETVLEPGSGDEDYLRALDRLLERMPECDITFVLAGGDIHERDGLGTLAVSERGARERDRRVHERLRGVGSVWLPGGGYSSSAWRLLAGTALVLGGDGQHEIRESTDPLAVHFGRIHAKLGREGLGDDELTLDDLGIGPYRSKKLLGFWTVSGIEYALSEYGVLQQIERLGYENPRVELGDATAGERMQVRASAGGEDHLLIELIVESRDIEDKRVLFVGWLTMRNPRARFTEDRPCLPGQEAPGLGLGREAAFLVAGMAMRLGYAGAAFRPAWYHIAYVGRHTCRFIDPCRQGRFEAMVRDLSSLSLLAATQAVDEKRVLLDGEPYEWEADDMVMGLDLGAEDRAEVAAERDRLRFTVTPASAS